MRAVLDMNILIAGYLSLKFKSRFKRFLQSAILHDRIPIFSFSEKWINIENHNPTSSLNFPNGSNRIFKKQKHDSRDLHHQNTFYYTMFNEKSP